jgi:hypothetical protein
MKTMTKKEISIRIGELLMSSWDPIGVRGMDGAHDEYDGYVEDVTSLVMEKASFEEIFSYLWSLETVHMGMMGNLKNTRSFAQELLLLQNDIAAG